MTRTWPPSARRSGPGPLDGIHLERRIDTATVTELRRRGHAVTLSGDWTLGRLSAVGVDAGTGFLMAAANPRGGCGYAVGR